ncbi:YbfB/YjiJ family MFS transporter [Mycolicibacterium sp. P1-18]|nr:YbfB/YjiJ family MFS transporter [Mycolicibacterium sp. P1-18]
MGIGRFAFTPILPMMTTGAGLSAEAGATLATANYVGYLAGALTATASPRLARSPLALRSSLVAVVVTLLAMPLSDSPVHWAVVRLVAGFASALVFVTAVNLMMDRLRHHSPHLAGWGFSGVGLGIAASGFLVLLLPTGADWRGAWWTVAALAAVLVVGAWARRHHHDPGSTVAGVRPSTQPPASRRWFVLLLICYTLEGVGYIVAGTFLVAAIEQSSPGWLGTSAWIVVGLAAAPSAALWAWLSTRFCHPDLLAAALAMQALGIALPAVAPGPVAALIGAILFGVTFIGVSTIALAAGGHLRVPRAVALLTAGYSVGQIAGPLLVAPLFQRGFHTVLLVGAGVVACAAVTAAALRMGYPASETD